MRNLRYYYAANISDFLKQSTAEILGVIHSNDMSAETTIQQSNTWETEVEILKEQLGVLSEGRLIFEYTIPRKGKRVDNVVLSGFTIAIKLMVEVMKTMEIPEV